MKDIFLFLFLFSILNLNAQCDQQDEFDFEYEFTSFEFYDVVSSSNGFFIPNIFEAGYLMNNGYQPIVFAGSVWLAGKDSENELRISAPFFSKYLNSGYYPDDNSSINCEDWDRTFTVTAFEIQDFIDDYNDNQQIDEEIPDAILYYPAMGNTSFETFYGFPLPSQNIGGLAPFFDRNDNGIYETSLGDYPLIEGVHSNFNFSSDYNSNQSNLGIEMNIQSNHWPLKNGSIQSDFDIKLTYQGEETLTDAYATVWLDAENICYDNSHIGCLPDSSLAFMYNNYELSECQTAEVNTEDTTTPMFLAQSTVNGKKMNSFITMFRPGSADVYPGMTTPEQDDHFYNLMQGNWRDGLWLTKGGNGYNLGSLDTTSYLYDHSDDNPDGPWTTCESGDDDGDKHFVMNFGPFNLEKGQILDVKVKTFFILNTDITCPKEIDIITLFDQAKNEIFVQTQEIEDKDKEFFIFPNPSQSIFNVDSKFDIKEIEVIDYNGSKIYHFKDIRSNTFQVQCEEWNQGVYFLKIKASNNTFKIAKFIKI